MADTTDVPDSSDSPESPPSALQTFLRAAQRRECLRMLAGALRLAASLEVDFATVTPEELDQLAAEHDLETLAQAAAAELGTDSREVFALARTITDLVERGGGGGGERRGWARAPRASWRSRSAACCSTCSSAAPRSGTAPGGSMVAS